ncbi:MAG: hypothetical protein CMK62_15005 [Pseudoalteromonadaceae bacterium]|nr:hypothetical protein [Pseudoalteromonadaceae bacterium]OUX83123.1 MAG: hypothetical protein CBC03_15665 [Pseudoalteromonas sp. TMED43]|tara:strand:+ start:533 stop:736 length:204 start_codon:yes stop_codon:yes gene_type:complete
MQIISSNNNGLQMQKGYALAIITNKGKIIQSGMVVESMVFEAMLAHTIETFCSKFTSIDPNYFKEPQ